jgi:hypothetical protein
VAFRRYSSDHVSAEDSAKVNELGMWAGTFQMPSDYRHAGDAPVPVRSKSAQKRSAPEPYRATTGPAGLRAAATSKATETGRAGGSTACPARPLRRHPRGRSSARRRRRGRPATGERSSGRQCKVSYGAHRYRTCSLADIREIDPAAHSAGTIVNLRSALTVWQRGADQTRAKAAARRC